MTPSSDMCSMILSFLTGVSASGLEIYSISFARNSRNSDGARQARRLSAYRATGSGGLNDTLLGPTAQRT
jgi:hypothetical protein